MDAHLAAAGETATDAHLEPADARRAALDALSLRACFTHRSDTGENLTDRRHRRFDQVFELLDGEYDGLSAVGRPGRFAVR